MTWGFFPFRISAATFSAVIISQRGFITRQDGKFKPTSKESKMSFIRFGSIQLHFVLSTSQINTFTVYVNKTGKRYRKWKSHI